MFGTFIVDSLRTFGASTLVALCALALGALASIVFAPFVGAFGGRSVKLRKSMTLIWYVRYFGAGFLSLKKYQECSKPEPRSLGSNV